MWVGAWVRAQAAISHPASSPPPPSRWLKALEGGAGLRVVAASSPALLATLEAAVRAGLPCLVEGCGGALDARLGALLAKAVSRAQGRRVVRLGAAEVEYHPGFRWGARGWGSGVRMVA